MININCIKLSLKRLIDRFTYFTYVLFGLLAEKEWKYSWNELNIWKFQITIWQVFTCGLDVTWFDDFFRWQYLLYCSCKFLTSDSKSLLSKSSNWTSWRVSTRPLQTRALIHISRPGHAFAVQSVYLFCGPSLTLSQLCKGRPVGLTSFFRFFSNKCPTWQNLKSLWIGEPSSKRNVLYKSFWPTEWVGSKKDHSPSYLHLWKF